MVYSFERRINTDSLSLSLSYCWSRFLLVGSELSLQTQLLENFFGGKKKKCKQNSGICNLAIHLKLTLLIPSSTSISCVKNFSSLFNFHIRSKAETIPTLVVSRGLFILHSSPMASANHSETPNCLRPGY